MSGSLHCGMVALVGRPNVGKSTLLNRLVGERVSITSQRPQTTRHRILGIRTRERGQIVYVDTPGLHRDVHKPLNRYMNRIARGSLEGVDCILLVVSAQGWVESDSYPLELVRGQRCPVILVINKIDRLAARTELLPLIETASHKMNFAEIVPVSALKGSNLKDLEDAILRHLPVQPPMYAAEQLTDKSERFLAAEFIREQVFRGFGQEVPYSATVRIDQFRHAQGTRHIEATILVEKEGQKGILIGKGGERLKTIGTRARAAMQKLFGGKVHLQLWVKVKHGWSESEQALKSLGYVEEP
jgi:GTP-binding protein Era